MPLDYRNYRLGVGSQYTPQSSNIGIDWSALGSGALGGASGMGGVAGGAASGALGGMALGPWGALGGAVLGAGGAALNAIEERKQQEQQQKNINRQMGMNALSLMRDDFKTALYRSMRGY